MCSDASYWDPIVEHQKKKMAATCSSGNMVPDESTQK